MPLQTVEPQRLYRQIAEQLRSLIASGEFSPGSRLPAERDLAKQLGVSRPSVREALIALEIEGMIDVRTGAGAGTIPRAGDDAFHTAVAQACGNEVLRDTVRGYWNARSGPLFERLGDYFENPASWSAALVEHGAVLEAIRSHNAAAARLAMQAHLKKAYSRYSASWRRANSS